MAERQAKTGGWQPCPNPEQASAEYAAIVERLKEAGSPHSISVKLFHFGELEDETLIEPGD
jgi:hypothetical protein